MRIVVTGAIGFVGSWFVEYLLQKGEQVTILVRKSSRIKEKWKQRLTIVHCDMQNYDSLSETEIEIGSADIFFHFAWQGTSGEWRGDEKTQIENVQIHAGQFVWQKN